MNICREVCICDPLWVQGAMATDGYWADPALEREETRLFSPSLDAMIGEDDPVRLIDEVLQGIDWSDWEVLYQRKRGQPPIYPGVLAGAILHGMYRGIRSSRKLEEACRYRFDFIWLVEGRRIDHTTFNKFRTKFHQPLKNLFRQIGCIAMTLGLIRLGVVGFDGTRVKANNSRYKTRTAKTLAEKLAVLDEVFERMAADLDANDVHQSGEGSPTRLPDELPDELADLQRRRQQVRQALEKAKAADEARRKRGVDPEKKPAQTPTTDPDSRVMPNKEGGYAPNYTPTATTDGHRGFLVDVDVLDEVNESQALAPSVDRIEENFGQKPEKILTDGGNNSGQVMQEMEQRDVELYAPVESSQPREDNPARRDDPAQPVPEEEWKKLKRNPQKKLDKSCFIYRPEEDEYRCPLGHAMPFEKNKPEQRGGVRVQQRIYRCAACSGCPLAGACVSANNKQGRTITRDEYEEIRERTAKRMASESGRKLYNDRPRIAETPFGILKSVLGLRQFLLRGLEKVKTEWLWAATSFNLTKLVREVARLRAKFAAIAAEAEV